MNQPLSGRIQPALFDRRVIFRRSVSLCLAVLSGLVFASLGGCLAESPPDIAVFEALVKGRSLDGRDGLLVYSPESRMVVLENAAEQATAWGRPEVDSEKDSLLKRLEVLRTSAKREDLDPVGNSTVAKEQDQLFRDLEAFVNRNAVWTETSYQPGLSNLKVRGDKARAEQVGHNPGGEFRDRVDFVRRDGLWYRVSR